MNEIMFDKVKKIRKIGAGMFGTTYLIEINGKRYALKKEHILEEDFHKNTKSRVWREIIFCKKMENISNHFMHLYAYRFIKDCRFKHKPPTSIEEIQNEEVKELVQSITESSYCVEKIFDLKDGTLNKVFWKLDIKQMYAMLIQLIYAIYEMRRHHFIHRDLHMNNVCYTKTNKEYIEILDWKIPTFGYIYSIIDYGLIISDRFELTQPEHIDLNYFQNTSEVVTLIKEMMVIDWKFWNYIKQNKIKLISFRDYIKQIKHEPEFDVIKLMTSDPIHIELLFSTLYPEKDQRIKTGKDIFISPLYIIPKEEILYIIIHINEPKKVIEYLYSKL